MFKKQLLSLGRNDLYRIIPQPIQVQTYTDCYPTLPHCVAALYGMHQAIHAASMDVAQVRGRGIEFTGYLQVSLSLEECRVDADALVAHPNDGTRLERFHGRLERKLEPYQTKMVPGFTSLIYLYNAIEVHTVTLSQQ